LNLILCQKTDERAKWHLKLPKNEKLAVKKKHGCIFLDNIFDLQQILLKFPSDIIFFTGYQSIIRLAVNWCDTAYVTKVGKKSDSFDRRMVNLDKSRLWHKIYSKPEKAKDGTSIEYCMYAKL
jgi:hypothetical protein